VLRVALVLLLVMLALMTIQIQRADCKLKKATLMSDVCDGNKMALFALILILTQ
jgi:hypothetical protein